MGIRCIILPLFLGAVISTVGHAKPSVAATPLAKPKPGVEACELHCESEFQRCEALPKATAGICFEQRRLCVQRCDPAALSSGTVRRYQREHSELLAPTKPSTAASRCQQGCEERRRTCAQDNDKALCNNAENLCSQRCREIRPAPRRHHR